MNATPATSVDHAAGLPAGFVPRGIRLPWPRRRSAHVPATVLAGLVAAVALVPLGFIVWVTLEIGWQTASALVFRGRVAELLVNTVLLELLAVPAALLLAVSLAWLTERSNLPGARIWSWLAVAPLAVPAFVHSYAWVTIMPGLNGLWAAVLISVLAYFPFIYLPVSAQLRRLDPALEDVGASLGHGPWRVFFQVVLPQLRLSICGGALLVSLHLLAEYGLFAMIRFDTFTTAIYDQFQSAFNGPAANMLAGVLVLLCLVLLGSEGLLRGGERYARIGSGAPAPKTCRRLGRWKIPSLALFAATAALSLGVPAFTLVRWLIAGGGRIWRLDELAAALGTTGLYAVAGAALATLAAIPVAWLSVRAPSRVQRVLEACHYYVGSLPGVVIALALVTITVRVALPLYQTVATVLLAYAMMFLPRALIGLRASLAQTPPELEHAAAALGRTPPMTLVTVTLRLAAPGAAASFALVALGIMTELTATLMLAPNGATTLAMRFWSLTSEIDYAAAAPYALLMVLFSLPLTLILIWQSERVSRP